MSQQSLRRQQQHDHPLPAATFLRLMLHCILFIQPNSVNTKAQPVSDKVRC